jgi:hypothetical protein
MKRKPAHGPPTKTAPAIRDRIKELRRVKASELKPNPRNWRTHPESQRAALEGVLSEIGYAAALLARDLPDGSLELVDGHLRAETTPEQEVPVLILDINEAEANKILTTFDPLAALAMADNARLDDLLRDLETGSAAVETMLADLAKNARLAFENLLPDGVSADDILPDGVFAYQAPQSSPALLPERFEILITCADEPQQTALIERLMADGFECRALIS